LEPEIETLVKFNIFFAHTVRNTVEVPERISLSKYLKSSDNHSSSKREQVCLEIVDDVYAYLEGLGTLAGKG
jgi:hypothetical protein